MECRKVLLITDSKALESWCTEELYGDFSVSVVSFEKIRFLSYSHVLGDLDAVLVDYSVEQERFIMGLYRYVCGATSYSHVKCIILYDSYSHSLSQLRETFRNADLFNLISPAFSLRKLFGTDGQLEMHAPHSLYGSLYGPVMSMTDFDARLKIVASHDECVLLLGESGSGKTWAAKKIHQYSNRCKEKFLSVNVAEFNPNLIEGNLFGITVGAFTGAVAQKGCFEEADGGTLLLDEIGELPVLLQAKLLSVIENRSYKRIGSIKECSFDEKLIFATNKNLEECVQNHTFRSDLFYRINCLTLYVPPLRSHKNDIPSLARQFSLKLQKTLSRTAIEKLCNYSWPGNIRELENVVKRACIFSKKEQVTADDIMFSCYG